MTYYVYSTLTCDNVYAVYRNTKDLSIVEHKILIKGGANVAPIGLIGSALHTPRGVVTEVSDDDHDILQKEPTFLEHVKRGFITVEKKEVSVNKVAKDLTPHDESRPLTPTDYDRGEERTFAKPKKV